jgi:hypothetical protein
MVMGKANKDTEAGVLPSKKAFEDMEKFIEQLVKAGVVLDGAGLQPSSKGARLKFSGGKWTVIDGPFTETKELVAGYALWQCKSLEEAIEWAKRSPAPGGPDADGGIEIRPIYEPADFGAALEREWREQEERLREVSGAKQ